MKTSNKKFAVAASIIVVAGAIVAALPVLVEAAVNVSDSGTAEPMWLPDATNNSGSKWLNASSGILSIDNSGDTINGNKTDQVAGNKWINVSWPDMDANPGIDPNLIVIYDSSGDHYVQIDAMEVWANIDGGAWHKCGNVSNNDNAVESMNVSITDSDWDYTFTSGSTMNIKLKLLVNTDSAQAATTFSSQNQILYPSWSVMGYE